MAKGNNVGQECHDMRHAEWRKWIVSSQWRDPSSVNAMTDDLLPTWRDDGVPPVRWGGGGETTTMTAGRGRKCAI